MQVRLDREDDVTSSQVAVAFRRGARVPVETGELPVGGHHEAVVLRFVLANEDHERRLTHVAVLGVAPPPGEEGVVATELLEVLVHPAGAVELDQKGPALRDAILSRRLDDGVRT